MVVHSKNVVFTKECVNLEDREHRRGSVKLSGDQNQNIHHKNCHSKDFIHAAIPMTAEKSKACKFSIEALHTNAMPFQACAEKRVRRKFRNGLLLRKLIKIE